MRYKRSVCIYVKSHFVASKIDVNSEHIATVFCEISLDQGDKLLLGCIYRSPYTNEISLDQGDKLLLGCIYKSPNTNEISLDQGDKLLLGCIYKSPNTNEISLD